MSSALKGSSTIRRFVHSDVIEIQDGIIFDFYTRLPHTIITQRKTDAEVDVVSQKIFTCQSEGIPPTPTPYSHPLLPPPLSRKFDPIPFSLQRSIPLPGV